MPNKTMKNLKKIKKNKNLMSMTKSISEKITPNNALKIINKAKGPMYIILLLCVLVIIYISSIIFYLNKLKSCQCFQDNNSKNYSNINYLIGIESIILIINIILALFFLFAINKINELTSGGSNDDLTIYYITFIILLLLYGYFIYYVYKLYQNIDENCECAQSWIRYLLYFQVLLLILQIMFIISSSFM